MDTGLLKYRITIKKPVLSGNTFGTDQDVKYTPYITIYARKIDVGGNKTIQNFELFTSQIVQFEIRYRTDINETYQIICNGKTYTIVNIKESEYKKALTITADLLQ